MPRLSHAWIAFCGVGGVIGGGFLAAKGAIRATDGSDLSFVPAALFLIGFGLLALAQTVAATGRSGLTALAGHGLAVVCIVSGAIALGFLFTGTIPETEGAPAAVGASYATGAAAAYLGQLALSIAAVKSEAMAGRLRWVPLSVVVLQFPIFAIADAIGEAIGDETVTDGLGMLFAGMLWMASSVAVLTTVRSWR